MPYSSNKVALANYLLAIFLFFLFFSHSYFSKFFKSNGIREFGSVDVSVFFIVTILFLLSLYVVFMWDFLYLYALTKYGKVNDYELNFIDSLVTFKLVGLVPLAALATFSLRNAGIKSIIIAMLITLLILAFKNPYFERRNAIGPVYLTIFAMLFPSLITSKYKFYVLLIIVMVLAFPIASILTHGSVQEDVVDTVRAEVVGHYNNMHYDAAAESVAILDYVETNGFSFGTQLMGTIFFFVPRSLWDEKPISTGMLIGDYLMSNYSMWFNNLSAPLPMEGYIDFGVFGVIFYAILLSMVIAYLEYLSTKDRYWLYFNVYFSFSIFFLMRGALLPAYAYLLAALVAFILVKRILILTKRVKF